MMKLFHTLLFMSLMLCSLGVMAQTVKTDYDRAYDFTKLKTFAFKPQTRDPREALAANPIVDDRIKRDLESQLTTNGFQEESADKPDFLIAYYGIAKERARLQDLSTYGPFGGRRSLDIRPEFYVEGTLIVDFIDQATNKLIWRGYATGTVDPKKSEKDIAKATEKLVKQFMKDAGRKK
jgi:hypothetical protein